MVDQEHSDAQFPEPEFVAIRRGSIDSRHIHGFVVGESAELILLQVLSDRVDLDGYTAIRKADVSERSREFARRDFCLKALALKRLRPVAPKHLDLSSVPSFLKSVDRNYPLFAIHRERVASDQCEIGRLRLSSGSTYALRWITPEATWADDEEVYRYSDVTRVDFDGEYENTLALVARHGALGP